LTRFAQNGSLWRRNILGLTEQSGAFPPSGQALPKGYLASRQVALKNLQLHLPENDVYFIAPPQPKPNLKQAVTAQEAIGDLPRIVGHLNGTIKRGTRHLDQVISYPSGVRLSSFAKAMRGWKGFRETRGVKDHVIRCTPRDYRLFRDMRPGDQYPQAHHLAQLELEKKLAMLQAKGVPIKQYSPEYYLLVEETIPPYDPAKFPNKWRKMEANLPARTLMAHLGKDSYSHIHYDDSQARTISVREAARLQSFPDGFIFCGTMNPAFRQIGNAVPPLLARAVARSIKKQILGSHAMESGRAPAAP